MQIVCASGSNCLPRCVEFTSKVLIIRYPNRIQHNICFMTEDSVVHTCNTCTYNHVPNDVLFLGRGDEILREINGQDHQTSMARISVGIRPILSWSMRSSESIGKQYSIAIVYGINNTSSKIIKIQNNKFLDRPRKCTFCSSQ